MVSSVMTQVLSSGDNNVDTSLSERLQISTSYSVTGLRSSVDALGGVLRSDACDLKHETKQQGLQYGAFHFVQTRYDNFMNCQIKFSVGEVASSKGGSSNSWTLSNLPLSID